MSETQNIIQIVSEVVTIVGTPTLVYVAIKQLSKIAKSLNKPVLVPGFINYVDDKIEDSPSSKMVLNLLTVRHSIKDMKRKDQKAIYGFQISIKNMGNTVAEDVILEYKLPAKIDTDSSNPIKQERIDSLNPYESFGLMQK
jgi:hypothetical protein